MEKKYDEEDDGRTIADMSGLDQNSVLSGTLTGLVSSRKRREKSRETESNDPGKSCRMKETSEEKKQRRSYTMGALSAGLLIGFIYLAGFGAVILLLLLIWGAF